MSPKGQLQCLASTPLNLSRALGQRAAYPQTKVIYLGRFPCFLWIEQRVKGVELKRQLWCYAGRSTGIDSAAASTADSDRHNGSSFLV